jgi:molecular chaperone GrpE
MSDILFQEGTGGSESVAAPQPETPAVAEPAAVPEDGERLRLEQELASVRDQLLRKAAEFDNFRRRAEREKADTRISAAMVVIHQLLPVLDGFERAMAHLPEGDHEKEFYRGVELLRRQFQEALEKLGLTRIETQGRKFDPHLHHAVEVVESPDHEDQAILEEFQSGYLYHDRLVRPAMVRVAKGT